MISWPKGATSLPLLSVQRDGLLHKKVAKSRFNNESTKNGLYFGQVKKYYYWKQFYGNLHCHKVVFVIVFSFEWNLWTQFLQKSFLVMFTKYVSSLNVKTDMKASSKGWLCLHSDSSKFLKSKLDQKRTFLFVFFT